MNKTLAKNLSRVHGYLIYKNLLVKSQHWSPERLEQFRLERLRKTLCGAANGTKYYGELFKTIGFSPENDLKSIEDIVHIPIVTKEAIREHWDDVVNKSELLTSSRFATSGTTGEPFEMLLSERQLAFDSACVFRHWSWCGYRLHDRVVALRSYVPEKATDSLWRLSRSQNTLFMSAYHLTPGNCNEYIDAILSFNPTIIRGYPSSLTLLAEYAYPVRDKFQQLCGIFASSETLLETERETIERTFGKRLFNWYGMTEPAIVLTECEAHDGMHVNSEYGVAELIKSSDLGPNEYRLITTGFHNPVMPFVRYDTGDIIRVKNGAEQCTCGRNLPLVETVVGRKDECIVTPDGRRLPSVNFYTVFRKYDKITRFQLIQYGTSDVVVKISLKSTMGRLLESLREELRSRLGSQVNLTIEVTDRFESSPDGKIVPILRKAGNRFVEEKEEYVVSSQLAWTLERQNKVIFKLDWNESDIVPNPKIRQALESIFAKDHYFSWYPDAQSEELVQALADYCGVHVDNILITHGSDLAMELIATSFLANSSKVIMLTPNYDNFRAVVEQRGGEVDTFPFFGNNEFPHSQLISTILKSVPRFVYFSNPNNPIGYVLDKRVISEISEACRKVSSLAVIDEAYYEFYGSTSADLVAANKNVIVLRSFSKAFGLAGLRLGYVIAHKDLIRTMRKVHNPKSVTMFAKVAALESLQQIDLIRDSVKEVSSSRELVSKTLRHLKVEYYPSNANFILIKHSPAEELVNYLQLKGILVRDRTRYFQNVGHVRLTIGGRKSAEALDQALRDYFTKQ